MDLQQRKGVNMNWAHHLSETTFGPRKTQPHQPAFCATKRKKITKNLTVQEQARKEEFRK